MALIQNLARVIQCHPSFRRLRIRHRQTVLLVFVLFLIYFMAKDFFFNSSSGGLTLGSLNSGSSYTRIGAKEDSDSIVRLRSQLGYLKKKLALEGHGNHFNVNDNSQPVIYAITPTYRRPVQKAELTRLCHTFLLVPNFHWILVEDAKVKSKLVTNFLRDCGVTYTHLNIPTPPDLKLKDDEKSWRKPRGVWQRNEALHWIRDHVTSTQLRSHSHPPSGVVYFADDDNTYSLELFEEMRNTKKVSVWPVGLVGGLMVERPRIRNGRVSGWDVVWYPQRPFAIDMAGFAVNLELFLSKTKAKFSYQVKRGHQESEFLKHLVSDLSELEPKAEMCTKVLVWHTRTEKVKLDMEEKLMRDGRFPSDDDIEV